MNAGHQTINWLYHEQLRVDAEWSVQSEDGFIWWADRQAQTISIVGEEVGPDGDPGYLISVRTDLLRGLAASDDILVGINTLSSPFASMSGPVLDEESGKLQLCSIVRIHDGIREWMSKLISMASVLQVAEARILASALAEQLGGEVDESGHPENGLRNEPDEMANIVENLVAPMGAQPCQWPVEEFADAVEQHMQQPPSLLANGGGQGLTVEFPYGEFSSLCRFLGDEEHPRYGNGLLLRQSFPLGEVENAEGARLALDLNAVDLTQAPSGYGFGSYCYDGGDLHFVTFLPNAIYLPGLLPNLYFAAAGRAERMSHALMDTKWEDMWDSQGNCRAKSSMERMLGIFNPE